MSNSFLGRKEFSQERNAALAHLFLGGVLWLCITRVAREVGEMFSGKAEDVEVDERGQDVELNALLGAFSSYHRVQKESDIVPEGVTVRSSGERGRDERVFVSRTILEFKVNRWDSDELGRAPVVHTWDLTPAAAVRLNRELLPAALDEAATREGLVVSNRGGYHSTPDFLSRLGDDTANGDGVKRLKPIPAKRFLHELIRGIVRETGKLVIPSVLAGRKRKGLSETNETAETPRPHETVTSSWVNVCRSGDSHGLHDHEGASWSGVYYVAVPESVERNGSENGSQSPRSGSAKARALEKKKESLAGCLVLRACTGGLDVPAPGMDANNWCVWTSVRPRPGRFVLFPSWTLHGVMPFRENESSPGRSRVSVAFNTGEKKEFLKKEES